MKKLVLVTMLLTVLVGCDCRTGRPGLNGKDGTPGAAGPTGNNGADGSDGANGNDGVDGTDGIDGTNGSDGATGPQGPAGGTGPAGPMGPAGADGTIVSVVKLCPGYTVYPTTFVEVAMCINNKLWGVYSLNNGFMTEFPPGYYHSQAVGSACNFTIAPGCVVIP